MLFREQHFVLGSRTENVLIETAEQSDAFPRGDVDELGYSGEYREIPIQSVSTAIEEYLRTYRTPGTLRAGPAYYRSAAEDAEHNRRSAQRPLTMPTLTIGGGAAMAGAVEACLRQVAADPMTPRICHASESPFWWLTGGEWARCGPGHDEHFTAVIGAIDWCAGPVFDGWGRHIGR